MYASIRRAIVTNLRRFADEPGATPWYANMTSPHREYGARARFGIGVPQANPTVEPEFRRWMPDDVECYAVRMTSSHRDPHSRIKGYLDALAQCLQRYDDLVLDGFGFAMTGSAYLYGYQFERETVHELEQLFGYRVITATHAIEMALRTRGAKRIQLMSPYPEFLAQAAKAYWTSRGYEVVRIVDIARPRDALRGIYEMGFDAPAMALRRARGLDVDAVVISGTGLPTFRLLANAKEFTPRPLLSSNGCLAQALLQLLSGDDLRAIDTMPISD